MSSRMFVIICWFVLAKTGESFMLFPNKFVTSKFMPIHYSKINQKYSRISNCNSINNKSNRATLLSQSSANIEANAGGEEAKSNTNFNINITNNSPTVVNLNRLVARISWFAWWIQIVLTVISGVILSFANTVRMGSAGASQYQLLSSGFALSASGVLVSLINSFTTWNCTRLCRRIAQGRVSDSSAVDLFKKYAKISVGISLFGMFVTLLGAEQIVGTLASKVLGQQLFVPVVANSAAAASTSLQALDIFLVQANTNTLVAHFAPMLFYTFLQGQIPLNVSQTERNANDPKLVRK